MGGGEGDDTAPSIQQIEADLKAVLGDSLGASQVQFDSSRESIALLGETLRWAKGRLQLNQLVGDHLDPYISSLREQTAELDGCLERLGVSHVDVERQDKEGVITDLASASQMLSLNDCSIFSFVSALSALQLAMINVDELVETEERFEAGIVRQFSDEVAPILSSLEKFSAEVDRADRENADALRALQAEKDFYLKAKQEEYRKTIQQAESELEQSGYHPRLSHDSLCELKTTLDELNDQIKPYMDRLQGYQELPPDLNLARMTVDRAKRELQQLQIEWQGRLSGIESVFNI